MKQYIDKSALVAEIEKFRKNNEPKENIQYAQFELDIASGYDVALDDIEAFIDTLEVKGVDLEKEVDKWYNNEASKEFENVLYEDIEKCAKHFFELGLRINNPITASDRGMAEEIIINLKRVEQDYHLDLTKEMEWLRNKTHKL